MYNFCTLFDSNYLSRGLALHRSLERVCEDFHLYIFAFDDKTANVLTKLGLKNSTIIPLIKFEDEELLSVKPTRNRAEYCWTCASSTILYVLENYDVPMCTYLDADTLFFDSPKALFDEMGSASIMITEHRFSPQYVKMETGKYCVQFVSIRNDEKGLTALRWWRDRCLEWCYARFEDNKFGDQKYLDDWTERFQGVHEMQHLGGGLAVWNIQRYDVYEKGGKLTGREFATDKEFPVIFYHYHYVRFYSNGTIELGRRTLSEQVIRLIYQPYLRWLEVAKDEITAIDSSFDPHGTLKSNWTWKTPLLYVYRKIRGVYNVYKKDSF
jgi:hypothetical protein